MQKLINYLSADNCPVINLFFDWNPIYTDDFVAGKKTTIWKASDDQEINLWQKL
jgi:hypothetical protein